MVESGSVTWLLAVIAVATSIQTLLLIVGAVMMARLYQRTVAQVHAFERDLRPLLGRAERALEAVDDAAARLRAADDGVKQAMAETREIARRSLYRFKRSWWPVLATGQAAAAAVRGFLRSRPGDGVRRPGRDENARRDAETGFSYEGGIHAGN